MSKFYSSLSATFILWLIFSASLQAQAIHDALELSAFVSDSLMLSDEKNTDKLYQLLSKHCDSLAKEPSKTSIINAYKSNPFIAPMLSDNLGGVNTIDRTAASRSTASLLQSSSGLSIPNATLLMGLTDFLVKRTKQELSIAFFKDFQTAIKNAQELQLLFPATSKVLGNIGEDIYQFKAFWEVLRASFLKDLQSMMSNLDRYIQASTLIKNPTVKHLMRDFFKVTDMFYDKKTPVHIIDYLANDAYLHHNTPQTDSSSKPISLSSALQLLGIISGSVQTKEKNGYWVHPSFFDQIIRNPITINLYLGLVYQQGKNTKIGQKTLAQHLERWTSKEQIQNKKRLVLLIKTFLDKAHVLVRLSESIRSKQIEQRRNKNKEITAAEKEAVFDDYFQFTQGVGDLILYAYDFSTLFGNKDSLSDSSIYHYLSIINDINTIALNIHKKQYVNALMNTLFCLEKLFPSNEFDCKRKQILKFGTFMATAVKAQNAEEVSDVIAAFALPPGSAAIKKYARFSIALNAYVGLSAGQEHLEGLGAKPFYAVSTPIGFSFSWGFEKYGAISLLASFIDIGALTAYRFEDSNAKELPDLKFENVLAPGAYLVYDIPKYPISLGLGAQLGPNLRSVSNGNLGIGQTKGWRWGAFIAVDIPMVSIYNSNKKYRVCKPCKQKAKKVKKN